MKKKESTPNAAPMSYAESLARDIRKSHGHKSVGDSDKSHRKKNEVTSIMIPKYRFDCINLRLKEAIRQLEEKSAQIEVCKKNIADLEGALLDAKIETTLAMHRAKSLAAAKALIDLTNLKLERNGSVSGLEEEVFRIKKCQSYLFDSPKKNG